MMKDDEEKQLVLKNIITLFPKTETGEWSVERTTSGLTNRLYFCRNTVRAFNCMYRVFGKNTDRLIDRSQELRLLKCLGEIGLAAKVLAAFPNALVYEYIEGRAMEHAESHTFQNEIATSLALFHNQASQAMQSTKSNNEEVMVLQLMVKWLNLLPSDIQKEYALHISNINQLGSPVVFCHNDLLPGNIILTPSRGIKFIDFEYAGWNYAAHDIANHLCEDIGFDVRPENLPSDARIRNFLAVYNQSANLKVTTSAVKQAIPLVNLLWSVWARVQDLNSHIDFDYLSYSKKRLNLFLNATN